jgi:hypothetical protein
MNICILLLLVNSAYIIDAVSKFRTVVKSIVMKESRYGRNYSGYIM